MKRGKDNSMPFKSKAQQGYLEANSPAVAKEFASKTPKGAYKNLPEKVGKSSAPSKGKDKMPAKAPSKGKKPPMKGGKGKLFGKGLP